MVAEMAATYSGDSGLTSLATSMKPGETELTWMRWRASSSAKVRVSISNPALEAE